MSVTRVIGLQPRLFPNNCGVNDFLLRCGHFKRTTKDLEPGEKVECTECYSEDVEDELSPVD